MSFSDSAAAVRLEDLALETSALRKVTWRLIPFLFLLYMLNILDRVNVGFASLTMLNELKMSEQVFGFGVSLFFIGYFIFEVPSNLILKRTGARRWIGRIMISWGLVSTCMMFVKTPFGFYLLRFLLGLAEAGFFPGIILYVSYWFPARQRARAVSRFMTASAVTGIVGGPLSGAIMDNFDQLAGLSGWQWLFLLEGLPTVLVGLWTFKYLTDRPAKANWLTPQERDWLVERLNQEEQFRAGRHSFTLWQSLKQPSILLLCAVYFSVATGSNSYGAFHPQILKAAFPAFAKYQIGLLSAIPSICAIISMVAVGLHSDRTGERRWHVAVPGFVAAAGWTMVSQCQDPYLVLVGLVLAQAGMLSMLAPFWSLATASLSGTAAAGGIAFINSVGNLGGFFGPNVIGQFGFSIGFLVLAGVLILGGGLVVSAVGHKRES